MALFNKLNRHGYNVQFSPFNPNHLAVAFSENFGIVGKGTLSVLNISSNGTIQEIDNGQWPDGLYDVAWSTTNLDHILTASADGALQLWNLRIKKTPIKTFLGHYKEVSSINWSHKEFILSASCDKSIKLWDISRSMCFVTFLGSSGIVYEATPSIHIPNSFASVSEDGNMKLWNTGSPNPVMSFRTHDSSVLSCDWCKHDANLIASCGSDSLIRGWDIRNCRQPVFQLKGGLQAIRRIRFSPHYLSILASVSFDHNTKIWDFRQSKPLEVFNYHTDVVHGFDWNSHRIGEMADCSWDSVVRVFTSETLTNIKNKI